MGDCNAESCQEQTSAKIAKMVKRSRLNNAFMLWCIAYAAITDFGVQPVPQLLELAQLIFSGWIQSPGSGDEEFGI